MTAAGAHELARPVSTPIHSKDHTFSVVLNNQEGIVYIKGSQRCIYSECVYLTILTISNQNREVKNRRRPEHQSPRKSHYLTIRTRPRLYPQCVTATQDYPWEEGYFAHCGVFI